MEISVEQLRAVSNKLWDHVESGGHDHIDLEHDFYWHIPTESVYDLQNEPKVHDVGQLSDDWSELQKLLQEPDLEPIAYDLVYLSALLRAIGEKFVS